MFRVNGRLLAAKELDDMFFDIGQEYDMRFSNGLVSKKVVPVKIRRLCKHHIVFESLQMVGGKPALFKVMKHRITNKKWALPNISRRSFDAQGAKGVSW